MGIEKHSHFKIGRNSVAFCAVAAAFLIGLRTPVPAIGAELWEVVQVTQDANNDMSASISGNKVCWPAETGNNLYSILVYDIQSQTTTNPGSAESIIRVAIDGNNVAYVYRTTSDAVVLVGDVGTRLFAENWSNVSQLFLTSSYLLWNADGSTYLHRIDANDTTVLSDVGLYDLDGENIVWYENLGGALADQVFIYNIITGQKHQITEYPNKGLKPKISGQYVVWYGHSSGEVDTDIFLYDIGTDTTTKLTYNEYDERNPDICGDISAFIGLSQGQR